MSTKNPKDPGFGRFEFRPGIHGFPKWRGVNFDADPATIPGNSVVNAENVTIEQGIFKSRFGQSKLNTGALTGAITGLHDDGGERGYGNILIYGPNDEGSAAQPQFTMHTFSRELGTTSYAVNPDYEEFSDAPTTASNYNETAYYGVQGGFLFPVNGSGGASHLVEYGRNCFFFNAAGQLYSVAYIDKTKSGGFYTGTRSRISEIYLWQGRIVVRPIIEMTVRIHDVVIRQERVISGTTDVMVDVVYMISANKNPAELYSYDAVRGLRTITSSLHKECRLLHFYDDKLYVMGGTGTVANPFGSVDTSTGTFTGIALPVAEFSGNNFQFANSIIYKGKLLLFATKGNGSTGSHVVSYDSVTGVTTTIRSAPGTADFGFAAYSGYQGATLATDGKLYVTLQHQESGTNKLRIEIYDGTSWTSSTVLWQYTGSGNATGPMVTANAAYNVGNLVNGASIAFDGAGFILVPTVTATTLAATDAALFWTKAFDFSTLYMDKYSKNPPQWGMAVQP